MEKESKLTKGLTLVTLFTLITGAMVGMAWAILANVFLDRAAPAVLISIAVASVLTLFVGLCFAELCAAMPYAGGAYIYVRRGIGKFVGFIAGWLLVLAYAAMMPGECIILGKLVNGIFPSLAPSIVGASLALLFTVVNLAGIRFSGIVQFLLTVALFIGIIIFIIAGVPELEIQNFKPFFGRGAGGIFLMIPIAMLAFMGYDVLPQAAEEVNAPIRKIVFLIPASIFFVAFMYILVLVISAGVVHWEVIAKNTEHIPIMPSVVKALGTKGAYIVIVAGICGLVTTMNAFMVGGSRLLYAMSQDGEIPSIFGRVSSNTNVPYAGILFIGALGIAGSFIQELIVLFDTAAASVLVSYFLVALTVIVLRKKEPELDRPYRIHGYPYIPVIAAVAVVPTWIIAVAILKVWALGVFIGWTLLGCGYYLLVRKNR